MVALDTNTVADNLTDIEPSISLLMHRYTRITYYFPVLYAELRLVGIHWGMHFSKLAIVQLTAANPLLDFLWRILRETLNPDRFHICKSRVGRSINDAGSQKNLRIKFMLSMRTCVVSRRFQIGISWNENICGAKGRERERIRVWAKRKQEERISIQCLILTKYTKWQSFLRSNPFWFAFQKKNKKWK